jgi:hypothetical protein
MFFQNGGNRGTVDSFHKLDVRIFAAGKGFLGKKKYRGCSFFLQWTSGKAMHTCTILDLDLPSSLNDIKKVNLSL